MVGTPDPAAIDATKAAWFAGYATAAGALGSFMAAGIALIVALRSEWREAKRRRDDRDEINRAFGEVLTMVLNDCESEFKVMEGRIHNAVSNNSVHMTATKSFLDTLAVFRGYLDLALSLRTTDTGRLRAALSVLTEVEGLRVRTSSAYSESREVPAVLLVRQGEALRSAVAAARAAAHI